MIYGSKTFWEIFAFTLLLNSFRSFGLAFSAVLYHTLLAIAPTEEFKERLERLVGRVSHTRFFFKKTDMLNHIHHIYV